MTKFSFFLISSILLSASSLAQDGFVSLFDGKSLNGWSTARSTKENDYGPFSVNKKEQALHVYAKRKANSKQTTDVIYTDKEYSHFILKLEYKWLKKRFSPRVNWERDSGLLFHIHGDLTQVWPSCLEMQIGESPGDKPNGKGDKGRFHSGDLFVLGKELSTETKKTEKFYDPEASPIKGKSVLTKLGKEKEKGEWNQMELHVHGSEKALFILNGETVLETTNFLNGTNALNKGRIGLQAEWAEILFRNIQIKELAPSNPE